MDLRGFLDYLDSENQLEVIKQEVHVEHEIAAYIRNSCDHDGPAYLFSNVKGYNGHTVVGGVYGTQKRIGMAVGFRDRNPLSPLGSMFRFRMALDKARKGNISKLADRVKTAPCQEVIETAPHLDSIPICTYHTGDRGPFITSGVQVVRDNVFGTLGVGLHRMFKIDDTHLGCLAPIERRVGKPYWEAAARGKSIDIAIMVGASPADVLASQAKIGHSDEKYAITEQLIGKPLSLAQCITSELLVAHCAEYIIEGHSIPGEYIDDTPFAEYCGTSSLRSNSWVVEVDCITHRKDPIFQALLTGMPPQEDSLLCAVPTAAYIYSDALANGTIVDDVSVYIGNNVFDTVVSIKKRSNSEVLNLIYRLLGNNYVKSVTIVDDDIDPNITEQVRWAMNTRCQPDRDIVITGLMHGASLDPSSPLFRSTSKIGYDCTVPIGHDDAETANNWRRHNRVIVPDFDLKRPGDVGGVFRGNSKEN